VPLQLHSDATNAYVYSPNPLIVGSTGANPFYIVTNNSIKVTVDYAGVVTGSAGNLMLVQGTAVASTSGTSIDFSSIPSWVKRIVVSLNAVSFSGTALPRIQIGPVAGAETSGYSGSTSVVQASVASQNLSGAGFDVYDTTTSAAYTYTGSFTLTNISSNIWVCTGLVSNTGRIATYLLTGNKTLAGALSVVRITSTNGTDTFDAGSVNIQYE